MRTRCRKFAMVLYPMLLCLGGAIQVLSHAATPAEQAFIDGQAVAQSATSSVSTNITNGTIATTVNSFNPSYYNYSTTAPETQYFQGGNGDTYTLGASKITSCANDPANPDKFLQQDCDAINYMVQNPATRPQFTINPDDPMILNTKQIEANAGTLAAQSLGFADPSAMGSFTACQITTTSTSPTYTTEVCNEYLSLTENMCIVGRNIVVDGQSNFQCNETANAYTTSTCDRTLNVTVTATQPPPVDAIPNYSCLTGTLSGTSCVQPTIAALVNYSCSAGSVLSGTVCREPPTTATASYSCGTGQTLSGTSCVTPTVNAILTYSCPSGAALSGASCLPAATSAVVTYTCPSGSTLAGTKCQAPASQPSGGAATATTTYTCSSGNPADYCAYYSGYTNFCARDLGNSRLHGCNLYGLDIGSSNQVNTPVYQNAIATTAYTCPAGYTLSGTTCFPPSITPPPTAATITYSCPSGSTSSGAGTICQAPSYVATSTFTCSAGKTLVGTFCYTPTVSATVSYSCPTGNKLYNQHCFSPPVGATVSYTCPASYILAGASCQPPATAATVTYTCPSGTQLSGSSCIPSIIQVISSTWTNGCAALEAASL